jgi:hypothetical protein
MGRANILHGDTQRLKLTETGGVAVTQRPVARWEEEIRDSEAELGGEMREPEMAERVGLGRSAVP